jgi:membrane protein
MAPVSVPTLVSPLRRGIGVFFSRDGRFVSAAIAFYALLSLVPLAYLALWTASLFVSEDAARAAMESELGRWTGPSLARAVLSWEEAARGRGGHALGAVSVVVLLYSATRLFAALERGLNAMWELDAKEPAGVPGKKRRSVLRQMKTRSLAFVVALLLGLVLAFVVAFRAAVVAAEQAGARLGEIPGVLEWVGATFLAIVLFFLLYTVLPRKRARALETLAGASVSAVMFLLGTHAVTSYVAHKGNLGPGETLLVLLWLRYAAQVFLLGAAVMGVVLRSRGALGEAETEEAAETPETHGPEPRDP